MLKNILAVVAGFVLGGTAVFLLESISSMIWDMPSSYIPNEPASIAQYIQEVPLQAKWMIVLANGVGGFVATLIALLISGRMRKIGLAAGLVILIASIANLLAIAHPVWMTICMPLATLLGILIALKIGLGTKKPL